MKNANPYDLTSGYRYSAQTAPTRVKSKKCDSCNGTGQHADGEHVCPICLGSGGALTREGM